LLDSNGIYIVGNKTYMKIHKLWNERLKSKIKIGKNKIWKFKFANLKLGMETK
jgi:hypothetical protein